MSGSLPSLKPADVIRILERNGFHRITKRKKHRITRTGSASCLFHFTAAISNREL